MEISFVLKFRNIEESKIMTLNDQSEIYKEDFK